MTTLSIAQREPDGEERNRQMAGGLVTLSSFMGSLKNAEKRVAEYVLANSNEVMYLSITDLAEKSGTSEATVSRLCRRLGYKGYQEMKISAAMSAIPERKQLDEAASEADDGYTVCSKVFGASIRGLNETLSILKPADLDRAVSMLANASKIEFYGNGGSAAVAKDAQHKFVKTGIQTAYYEDAHMQLMSSSLLGEGDVAVAISYSGSNKDILEAMKVAKAAGAFVLLITGFAKCPLAKVADVALWVSAGETFKSESSRSRIAQLCLLDSLYVAVMLRLGEGGLESLRKTRDAVARKRF
jgi:RpiR family carbohydrate utilization transcriptional regulator